MEANGPQTLQEAILYFAIPDNCLTYIAERRWSNGVVACPTCGSNKVSLIFEDSPLGLDKWLPCVWLITNAKNGISSYEVGRALGVTQKTAWFMLHRVRLAHQGKDGGKLSGEVEVDESFIGGKARNMHANVKARKIQGRRGPEGKAIVAAVMERGGQVRAKVIDRRKKKDLQALVREHVEPGSALYSDALKSYEGLAGEFVHQVIDHAVAYVDGNVHTNSMENFWSLLKRGINGTYVSVEPYHLFRYLDEQAFRFNNRIDMNDADRFDMVMRQIVGKSLTYSELLGSGRIAP